MDVLVLIDKLDDVVHNARPVPLTDQVRVDREEIYDLLDQMRATIPEEIKQARWIVKERQEMLAEAKREAERIVREAREQQARLISDEEVTKQAERAADEIVEDARTREREIRLGAEDYADEILNTLEVNLQKFLAAVQRGRDRLAGRDEEPAASRSSSSSSVFQAVPRYSIFRSLSLAQRGSVPVRARGLRGRRRSGTRRRSGRGRRSRGGRGSGWGGQERRRRGPSGRCRARRRSRRGCAAPRLRCRAGRPRGRRPRGRCIAGSRQRMQGPSRWTGKRRRKA